MKKYFLLLLVVCLMCGCGKKAADSGFETVVYDENSKSDFLGSGLVSEIEIIPLETTAGSLIGEEPRVAVAGSGFYVTVPWGGESVLRFDPKGKFLNTIGRKGGGPNEYNSIYDIEIDDDSGTLHIYSGSNKAEYLYSLTGEFKGRNEMTYLNDRAISTPDGHWLYLGYANGLLPYRLVFTDKEDNVAEEFLPADFNVLPMREFSAPVFSRNRDKIYARTTFDNHILEIGRDRSVDTLYGFDFGRYNIPQKYFEFDDARAAGIFLLEESDFGVIWDFMCNDDYAVAITGVQNAASGERMVSYGIKDRKSDSGWHWVHFDPDPQVMVANIFSGLQAMTENSELIILVEAHRLLGFGQLDSKLFKNPEILGTVAEDSNPVILKCKLK